MGFLKLFAGSEKEVEMQEVSAETCADDGEIIAVIAAAIAAYEGAAAASNLTVRKINRTSGPALPWNVAGRHECIDSRRM